MAKRRGHGEGSIHQSKDGRWCAIVDLGWVNGKRKRKYLYGATRKEVADALKVLHRDLAAGVAISTDSQTVKTFLTRWLSEVVSQRNKTRTYEGYERIVELYLTPSLGTIPLGKLGPQHVQRMVNELVAKGLAPNTIRNVRAVLRRALNQAMRWRLVTYNAASLVETPRIEQEEMSALTEQQARALLRTLKGDRLEALYRVALSLGLRSRLKRVAVSSIGRVHLGYEDTNIPHRSGRPPLGLYQRFDPGGQSGRSATQPGHAPGH